MIVNEKFPQTLKNVILAAVMLLVLFNCTEEQIAPTTAPAAASVVEEEAAASDESLNFSLTISGAHTTFSTAKDCSSCTFVVPANTFIVDGKEKGFKPGDVICLNAATKYGQLELVNIEGSPEKPIVITTVGETASAETSSASTTEEPY
jgi:hypothetical protein